MEALKWEGPEDSDEEIEDMLEYKDANEERQGVKYSKNGLSSFIDHLMETECPGSQDKNDAWKCKIKSNGMELFLK